MQEQAFRRTPLQKRDLLEGKAFEKQAWGIGTRRPKLGGETHEVERTFIIIESLPARTHD